MNNQSSPLNFPIFNSDNELFSTEQNEEEETVVGDVFIEFEPDFIPSDAQLDELAERAFDAEQ